MSEPLYPRLLGLKHVHPNAWQRAVLGEGMVALGLLLLAADLASAWTPLVLPVAVGALVKAHDVVAGLLPARPATNADPEPVGRVGSDELWSLLADARERTSPRPFALLATDDGPVEVAPPSDAAVLTGEEQTGALRMGLAAAAQLPEAPRCAVIAFDATGDGGYIGYEPGVGLLVDADLEVVNAEAPSVYPPETAKAPTP